MSDSAKKRLAIDLDEIERQLRQTAPPATPDHAPPQRGGDTAGTKPDPLAELARIVGQDDPYRTLLSADRAGVAPARHDPDMDAVFAYGHDETMPQNRDQHQDPQSLPDWRTQWREEEGGRREDSPQEVTFERDTAHGNAGPGIHAPAGHSRDQGFDAHGHEVAAWQPPQRSAAERDARSFQQGPPSPDTTGGVAGDEDRACFARTRKFNANPAHRRRFAAAAPRTARPAAFVSTGGVCPALRDRRIHPFSRSTGPARIMAGILMQSTPTHRIHSGRMRMPMTALMTGAYDEDFDYDVDRSALRRRNRSGGGRKAALVLGAVLGMAVIGVASAIHSRRRIGNGAR